MSHKAAVIANDFSNQCDKIETILNKKSNVFNSCIMDCLQSERSEEYLERLRAMTVQLAESNLKKIAFKHALQQLKVKVASENELFNFEEFMDERLDQVTQRLIERGVENSAVVEKFDRAVVDTKKEWAEMRDDGEDGIEDEEMDENVDIVVAKTKKSLICPISQTKLQNPMTNPKCGHTYSKDIVYQWLQEMQNRPRPCPVSGCNQMIQRDQLRPDMKVLRMLNQQSSSKKNVEISVLQ